MRGVGVAAADAAEAQASSTSLHVSLGDITLI